MSTERIPIDSFREMNQGQIAQLIKTIEKMARNNEIKYWGCSQATLGALQRYLKIGDGGAFRAATAFAGGIASNREACGAVVGGVMAIGLVYGRARYEIGKIGIEQVDLLECAARAGKFCDRFRAKFGGLKCSEVRAAIGFDAEARVAQLTPEILREHSKCGDVAGTAAAFAAEIILEPAEVYNAQVVAMLDMMKQLRRQMAEESRVIPKYRGK